MAILFTTLKVDLNMRKSIKNFWANRKFINQQVSIEYLIRVYYTRIYLYVWKYRLERCRDGKLWKRTYKKYTK